MKKSTYLLGLALGASTLTLAQVGIGTSTPSSPLDIQADDAAIDLNSEAADGSRDPKINFQLTGTTTFSIGLDDADDDKLKIGVGAPETSTRMTIDGSGNVGIGNTSPTVTLDVDGDAIFNESGADKDFRIEGDTDTEILMVDASADAIGISTTTPASTIDIQGSMGLKVTTITSATTLDQTHNVVLCNTGTYTVTLPAAASNTGKVYYIKNIDSDGDYFTIDGNSTETIDGDETFELLAYNHAVRIISDGSGWHVINEVGKENKDVSGCGTYFTFTWQDVTNPETGLTWMDRNLGAQRVALSSTDDKAYGDLYQWGRAADGHQCRTSSTTSTNASDETPGDALFITEGDAPFDWLTPQDDNLWQGVDGTNNPCPGGYRLPTDTELDNEHLTWSSDDSDGAIASVLKLPMAGSRFGSFGWLLGEGSSGGYWSSTVSGTGARFLYFNSSVANVDTYFRANGYSVRCIKD